MQERLALAVKEKDQHTSAGEEDALEGLHTTLSTIPAALNDRAGRVCSRDTLE